MFCTLLPKRLWNLKVFLFCFLKRNVSFQNFHDFCNSWDVANILLQKKNMSTLSLPGHIFARSFFVFTDLRFWFNKVGEWTTFIGKLTNFTTLQGFNTGLTRHCTGRSPPAMICGKLHGNVAVKWWNSIWVHYIWRCLCFTFLLQPEEFPFPKDLPSLELTARTWNWMVGRWKSVWDGLFSGAMLVSGSVDYRLHSSTCMKASRTPGTSGAPSDCEGVRQLKDGFPKIAPTHF